jgi:hypothetical protein
MTVKKLTNNEMNKIWNAVYDTEQLNSDPDVARNLADEVKHALEDSNNCRLQIERTEMIRQLKDIAGKVFATIAGILLLAGAIVGIYFLFTLNNGDYAGFGQSKVGGHDVHALNNYFAPKNIDLVSRKKGHAPTGEKAWASTYRVDNKMLCVYVWDASTNIDENFKVTEGGCK